MAPAGKKLRKLAGAGNSTVQINYTAIDPYPYLGLSYYRLKQTDFDGQFAYSEIRVVEMMGLQSTRIKIYPNPGKTQITIEGRKSELAEFKLYNLYGQDVTASVRVTGRSNATLTMDISNLPNGVYTLKTKNNTRKIIKQ